MMTVKQLKLFYNDRYFSGDGYLVTYIQAEPGWLSAKDLLII